MASGRTWVSEPEFTDDVIVENTGRSWNEWCDIIEAWPGHVDGHAAIAAHLHAEYGLSHWWSQGVTVSYERICGLRLPHQRADGTFTADKSKTVDVDADELRAMLLDDAGRATLFPGVTTELRSKPTAKAIRIGLEVGFVLISLEPKAQGQTKVVIAHEKLPNYADVAEMKERWDDWLSGLSRAL